MLLGVSLNLLESLCPSLQSRRRDTCHGGAWVPLTRQAGSILRRKISKDRKRDGRSMGFGANFRNHLCSESGEGSVRQTSALTVW